MAISKVKLPNNTTQDLHDSRISGVDTTVTSGSSNVVTSGGVYTAIPTVPNLSTSVSADKASDTKTSTPKSVYDFVKPATQSSQPAGGMVPGVLYKLGTLTGSITMTLATATDLNVVNEYMFTFTAGNTAPTITWPASVTMWAGNCVDNGAPVIIGGNSYEVSILDGKGIIVEWEA